MMRLLAVSAVVTLSAASASAAPLALDELYRFGTWLTCSEACGAQPAAGNAATWKAYHACRGACGTPSRTWEKNGSAAIDRADQELAWLEVGSREGIGFCYLDAARSVIAVSSLCPNKPPATLCTSSTCTNAQCAAPLTPIACTTSGAVCWYATGASVARPIHCTELVCAWKSRAGQAALVSDCADPDGDSLPTWLDTALGTGANSATTLCSAASPCGFDSQCKPLAPLVGGGTCAARPCAPNCTAFHLEAVAEDDQQAIVHLWYDYSPVPARLLDLYVEYSRQTLSLEDARPLAPLAQYGKEVAHTHLADGTLRVSVYDTDSSAPVPFGPIVELVFRKKVALAGAAATWNVGFSDDESLLASSIAPAQPASLVEKDAGGRLRRWGGGVAFQSPASSQTKLRLWYGFDAAEQPLTYSAVPTPEELCARQAACANETDDATRKGLLERYARMQAGTAKISPEPVKGITQDAGYFDGRTSVAKTPVFYDDGALNTAGQSMSFSTWFYAEPSGDLVPHVLWSHQTFDERSRLGIAWQPKATKTDIELFLFDGDLLSVTPPPTRLAIAPPAGQPLKALEWHHIGLALDANSRKADVYLDGDRVLTGVNLGALGAPVTCPQFFANTDVLLHEEGDVLGGRPPEVLHTSIRRNGLYHIQRTDPQGLLPEDLVSDGQHNFRDPDYSAVLDRLVFTSDESGETEIWVSNGDGTGRRQVTTQFGRTAAGIECRRPRWAPDGRAIVFESNAWDAALQDNDFAKVTHLYYLAWDPATDAPTADVGKWLDYEALLDADLISDVRLTAASVTWHSTRAQWLVGRAIDGTSRGTLVYQRATADLREQTIRRLRIGSIVQAVTDSPVEGGAGDDLTLLASHRSVTAAGLSQDTKERIAFTSTKTTRAVDPRYSVETSSTTPGVLRVNVVFAPAAGAYSPTCWDLDGSGVGTPDEDLDEDGTYTVADCYPTDLHDVLLQFDPAQFKPDLASSTGATLPGKVASVGAGPEDGLVRVQVTSKLRVPSARIASISGLAAATAPPFAGEVHAFAVGHTHGVAIVGDERRLQGWGAEAPVGAISTSASGVRAVAAGSGFTVALDSAGAVTVYGSPALGGNACTFTAVPTPPACDVAPSSDWCQCRLGTQAATVNCAQVAGKYLTAPVVAIAAGYQTIIALDDTGRVHHWGCAETLTAGGPGDATAGVIAIATAEDAVYALKGDGRIVTWGANSALTATSAPQGLPLYPGASSLEAGYLRLGIGVGAKFVGYEGNTAQPAIRQAGPGARLTDFATDTNLGDLGVASSGALLSWPNGATTAVPVDLKHVLGVESGFWGPLARQRCMLDDANGDGAISDAEATSCTPGRHARRPLVPGTIATIRLLGSGPPPVVVSDNSATQIFVKDLPSGTPQELNPDGRFERVLEGAFSPDGERLALATIADARPTLLATQPHAPGGAWTAVGAYPIYGGGTATRGLTWSAEQGFYACNFVGAQSHFQTKALRQPERFFPHHGGLDELKFYSGVRPEASFRSEAERGLELLARPASTSAPVAQSAECANDHSECPPYHLCNAGKCSVVPCSPSLPGTCDALGARCALRPLSVPSPTGSDWVCAADCNTDSQCFTQACLNGPCRFCDPDSLTCLECREASQTVGGLTTTVVEGCPDQRSWRCESGSCVSDCYDVSDGASIYLCDPTTEYCDGGHCVLHSWDWSDFSPASFSGVADMRQDVPKGDGYNGYTAVLDQTVPVAVRAFGAGDYGRAPTILVEAKGGPFYGSDWHELGRISVYAASSAEADAEPLTVTSRAVFTELRLRLVTSPYDDVMGGSTGLDRDGLSDFCEDDFDEAAAGTSGAVPQGLTKEVCFRRAQSSYANLGYPVGLPEHLQAEACAGREGCPSFPAKDAALQAYFIPGRPTVAILGVDVAGKAVNLASTTQTTNTICGYQGYATAPGQVLYYGDYSKEVSNLKSGKSCKAPTSDPKCTASPEKEVATFPADTKGFALLNCNFFNPGDESGGALLHLRGIILTPPQPKGAVLSDTGDQCILESSNGVTKACTTWRNDASLDPQNAHVDTGASVAFETLEFGLFRSFAYDDGYTSVPFPRHGVTVTGLDPALDANTTVTVAWAGATPETRTLPSGAGTIGFDLQVPEGQPFTVSIPAGATRLCSAPSKLHMGKTNQTVAVTCRSILRVTYANKSSVALTVQTTLGSTTGAALPVPAGSIIPDLEASGVPGDAFQIAIVASPDGQVCTASPSLGVLSTVDPVVDLNCSPVPVRRLRVDVTGLDASAAPVVPLRLRDVVNGIPAFHDVSQNGTVELASRLDGASYAVSVVQQPDRYPYTCTGGASGVVDGSDITLNVTCARVTTHPLSIGVLGPTAGLKVTLGTTDGVGNALSWTGSVADNSGSTSKTAFAFTPGTVYPSGAATLLFTGLRDGAAYTLSTQPGTTDVTCSVVSLGVKAAPTAGTPALDDVSIQCSQNAGPSVTSYSVGGTIVGLGPSSGLRLGLRTGDTTTSSPSETVDLAAGSTKFTFKGTVRTADAFKITVERNPWGPGRICTFGAGAEGVVQKAAVAVTVTCAPGAGLTLAATTGAPGVRAKAHVFRFPTTGAPVLVGYGTGTVADSGALQLTPAPLSGSGALILAANTRYHAYLAVNSASDFDGLGDPNYSSGDLVGFVEINVPASPSADIVQNVTLGTSLVRAVLATNPSLSAPLVCGWAPAGLGSVADLLPWTATDGVLGIARANCSPSNVCADSGGLLSTMNPALVSGRAYDVTCWQDMNGDGLRNAGDRTGYLSNVPASGGNITIPLGVL